MFLCDNNWKFWTFSIIQLWNKFSEKLEYCFLFESTNISIQNCSIKSSFVLTLLKQIEWVIQNGPITNRSSHQRCSIKKGVLRNFAKSTGKHLCQSLFFSKVAGACNFIKKGTLAQEFSSGFCKFLRTPFVQNTLERLLLECAQGYQQMQLPWNVSHNRYCENFAKILRKHLWWNLPFL